MESYCIEGVLSITASEHNVEQVASRIIGRLSKNQVSSFIKRLTFYIEHINIINKTLKDTSYDSQVTVLSSLKTKLLEESNYRSLSGVNNVVKSYQENF